MIQQRVDCLWEQGRGEVGDLESLHTILMCAARQGCSKCVECSERALKHLLATAGKPPREE